MKFNVQIERSAYEYFTVTVDAENEDEAQAKAQFEIDQPEYIIRETEFSGDDESSWEAVDAYEI